MIGEAAVRTVSILCCAILAGLSSAASAIITRHDVADRRYRELGRDYRDSVVDVALLSRKGEPIHGNGQGTLIAEGWILTAAHVARYVKPNHSIYFRDRPVRVSAVFVHPDYVEEGMNNDIALLQLATPIADGRPACLYPSGDEVGRVVTVAGSGLFGTGLTGPTDRQPVFRAATVRVDGAQGAAMLHWTFRNPGDSLVTDLEGISGPGDSGGPAFLDYHGQRCVAGVSSGQDDHGKGEGRYRVTEFYPRVSYFKPWIDATMRQEESKRILH